MHLYAIIPVVKEGHHMNNVPFDPNDPHNQDTVAGQYPQWSQQPPPPPYSQQPGQYSQSGQNFPSYPPPYPSAQPPMQPPPLKPCSDAVLSILFLLDLVGWICAFVPGGVGNFGKSVVTSIIFVMLIIDWKGVVTFDGKINWKKFGGGKRFLLLCLYFAVLPFALLGYFVRRINAGTAAKKQKLPELPYRKGRPALAIAVGFFVFIFALAVNAAPAPGTTATTTTSAPTQQVVHTAPTQTPTPIPSPTPTTMPSPTPSPTPTPTPTPTPVPAPPVQQPAQQQPAQQAPAPATGVNNNPWGYDFNPGSYIYNPNSGFCSYFSCVTTFWKSTNGYVVECGNNEYSHSGGVSGACSRDGGVQAILYQHP